MTDENFNPFADIAERKAELAKQHEAIRASKEYQDQAKYLGRMTQDFLKTTQCVGLLQLDLRNSLTTRSFFAQ